MVNRHRNVTWLQCGGLAASASQLQLRRADVQAHQRPRAMRSHDWILSADT